MSDARPTDPRLELLDAYADGELSAAERADVDELLATSLGARAQLGDIERVRTLVRDLPEVDVPFGFYERLDGTIRSRRRRTRRRVRGAVFASVAAVAAAVVLVLAITPVGHRQAPPVEAFDQRHATLVSSTRDLPAGYSAMTADELDAMPPYEAPEAAANGYRREAGYRDPEGVHLLYRNGTSTVSVFEQQGHVDWGQLPAGGSRVRVDGDDAWTATLPAADALASVDVVVVAHHELIVTVVGAAPHDDVVAVAGSMPEPPTPSVSERLTDTCEWLAGGFGFPG